MEELSNAEIEAKAAADFEAGRNAVRGTIQEDTEGPPKREEALPPEDSKEEKVDNAGDDSSAEEPIILAGLTEKQLKVALAKAGEIDSLRESYGGETQKIYGKFGEIQRELKKLSEGGGIGKVDAKKFAKINELLGEEFGSALAEDLAGLAPANSSPADLEERLSSAISTTVSKLSRDFEIKLLTLRHPDWQEKKQSTDYDLWFNTLPPNRQAEIRSSTDGLFAAKALDEFDSWKSRGDKKKDKTERLSRAIAPGGSPPEPPDKQQSADAAFEAGRRAVRKRLGLLR